MSRPRYHVTLNNFLVLHGTSEILPRSASIVLARDRRLVVMTTAQYHALHPNVNNRVDERKESPMVEGGESVGNNDVTYAELHRPNDNQPQVGVL